MVEYAWRAIPTALPCTTSEQVTVPSDWVMSLGLRTGPYSVEHSHS